jgi:hypothetical protein
MFSLKYNTRESETICDSLKVFTEHLLKDIATVEYIFVLKNLRI